MRWGVIIAIAAIILIVIGTYFFSVHRNQITSPAAAPGTTAGQPNVEVVIQNFAFSPSPLNVKVGDTVRWTNRDSAPHTVSSDSNAFESGTMNQGQAFQFTFKTPGTYPYHCSVHPNMKATVVVQ